MPLPMPSRKPNPVDQAILGVVHQGAKTVKGMAGLASMTANAKLQEADDYQSGKTQRTGFVPVSERYQNEPWYTRIPKQVRDGLSAANSPDAQQYTKEASGKWASESRGAWTNIRNRADKEYAEADKTIRQIVPKLGTIGNAASFATSVIPAGMRALDIPVSIGQQKTMSGGVAPALATVATRKVPGLPVVKATAQQATSMALENAATNAFPHTATANQSSPSALRVPRVAMGK